MRDAIKPGSDLRRYYNTVLDYLDNYLTRDKLSPLQDYFHLPSTTYSDALSFVTEVHGYPKEVFFALESLERIKALIDAKQSPSEEPISPERAFLVAYSALRAGMMVGAIVGEKGGKERSTTFDIAAEQYRQLEAKVRKQSAEKAANARHRPLQEFKDKAAAAARAEWDKGSTLNHYQMSEYLAEEYQDENGRYPFTNLPDESKSSPGNVLRDVCKKVAAIDMNRPDLVFGLNKKK